MNFQGPGTTSPCRPMIRTSSSSWPPPVFGEGKCQTEERPGFNTGLLVS
jgi:hypothetical protein